MTDNKKNDNLMQQVDSQFRRTYSAAYSWADVLSAYSMLTGLRGFWPMTTANSAGDLIDRSGLGKTLGIFGAPLLDYTGLTPFATFPGASYWARADEADLDILGTEVYIAAAQNGMTVGGWFKFTALGAAAYCMAKDNLGAQRSFYIRKTAGDVISFVINGAVSLGATAVVADTWYFIVGRYIPSTSMSLFINDAVRTGVVGIPAAINNSTASFVIGADSAGGNALVGNAALCFYAAAQLSNTVILSLYHSSRALFGR